MCIHCTLYIGFYPVKIQSGNGLTIKREAVKKGGGPLPQEDLRFPENNWSAIGDSYHCFQHQSQQFLARFKHGDDCELLESQLLYTKRRKTYIYIYIYTHNIIICIYLYYTLSYISIYIQKNYARLISLQSDWNGLQRRP